MAIEPDPLGEAADQLVGQFLDAVDGYGENANVTALALVAHVRLEPAPDGYPATGQTLVFSNVAPGLSEEDTRRYLVHALEEAAALAARPQVNLDDLPRIDDD